MESQPKITETIFRLARAWHLKGKIEQAIRRYQETIQLDKNYIKAYLYLGKIFLEQEKLDSALSVFCQAIEINSNESEIHKYLIEILTKKQGIEAAFKFYKLKRYDNKKIVLNSNDILACVVVRNEARRLPYFLSFYREKGISKFLIIDNQSSDQTCSYLSEQQDVYLWQSGLSFNRANFGSAWFEILLKTYGINHWCLIIDADELFYYPKCETKTITELCEQLDRQQKKAMNAILLDMYSDRSIQETYYETGQNFLDICPYFDRKFYHNKYDFCTPYRNQLGYFGGVRQRVFGSEGQYYLSKVPLIKYGEERVLAGGQHFTNCSSDEIASETGCLLHFKFFSSFLNYVQEEILRKEHYGEGMQYSEYAKVIKNHNSLTLYNPHESIKFKNSHQLVELGIMNAGNTQFEFPPIFPLPQTKKRPFWSVIITVYNRLQYLEKALTTVIEQAPNAEEMQIEVIYDTNNSGIEKQILAIIQKVAGDRVSLYQTAENVGHPHIFNICLQRAQGYWVHLLHDDDWVEPKFYQTLRAGIDREPVVGAAFCRHFYINDRDQSRLSILERDTPGIIDNWLEKIATLCRFQCPAVVVKREVYEQLGGFCPQAKSAFDWEMWKRIAVNYSYWYEPQPLAYFREHSDSESFHLIESAKQLADTRKTIEISKSYLPDAVSDYLSKKALQNYAVFALDRAKRQFQLGNYQGVLVNVQEGLKCNPSVHTQESLLSLLQQVEKKLHND
ncbi:MAG: glycosyltransferase family 2 protein [Cyanobacteria bacterium P01_H01_bin.35]